MRHWRCGLLRTKFHKYPSQRLVSIAIHCQSTFVRKNIPLQELQVYNMAETHAYPGVNLPLRFLCQEGEAGVDFYRLGSSEQVKGSTSPMLQVREVAMMILMDRLTDKPNWHEKVFNEEIVAKWRHEALTQDEAGLYQRILGGKNIPMPRRARIVSEKAFDYVSRLLMNLPLLFLTDLP